MDDSNDWKAWSNHVLIELRRLSQANEETLATLTTNTFLLDEHIRRTVAAEAAIEKLKEEQIPLKTHVATFGAIAKVVGFIGVLVSIAGGLYKIFAGG